ncbi:hypothetical protein DCC85_02695 [Paenibacillus sp. CAA11]|uniref:cupin domain-containing protein n=1 Tax=Paenibacillus sp. CAA11 TaxID=1532905 RepID=UPI000D38F123|nr:cupin domain-containing protein [Paenibacillus sp. CAA11]AWB43245.1 hypothetical protein DCC85_02695 [Paenibacillus sp. CAA11]
MTIPHVQHTPYAGEFTYDLRYNVFYQKDPHNYILALGIQQLKSLGSSSLLDIYLTQGNVVEPHYHQNASELVYCISGEAVVSLMDPFRKELIELPIKPGQVANVPQGWWHYEIATTPRTHLLAIFDTDTPEVIFGSDILRLTPPHAWTHAYGLNEPLMREALAPIQQTTIIGPPMPKDCPPTGAAYASPAEYGQTGQPYPLPTYHQQGYSQSSYAPYGYNPQAYTAYAQGAYGPQQNPAHYNR